MNFIDRMSLQNNTFGQVERGRSANTILGSVNPNYGKPTCKGEMNGQCTAQKQVESNGNKWSADATCRQDKINLILVVLSGAEVEPKLSVTQVAVEGGECSSRPTICSYNVIQRQTSVQLKIYWNPTITVLSLAGESQLA
ncbi:hypothetical protein J6590_005762 [Homalodisca vitripennis]|nr:hypothetical protein J6590_005762 [Homalodisca vitripennis]